MSWAMAHRRRRVTQSGMTTRLFAVALALGLSLLTACGDDPDRDADAPVSTSSDQTTDSGDQSLRPMSRPAYHPRRRRRSRRFKTPESWPQTASSEPSCTTGPVRQSTCSTWRRRPDRPATDACAEAWPPVLTAGNPVAGAGVRASLLGTTERTDGRTQVTYNGHPLYFYAHEGKHEVECHNVFLNGGTWYAVQPDGNAAPAA